MTGSEIVLSGSTKVSTRSVSTTLPLTAMLFTRNSMRSTPVVNICMIPRIPSLPSTGSTGMLWYTASSVK